MRIAFYAPMKPPDAARPSGDRRIARLLMRALRASGHRVALASAFRTWQDAPDATRQARLADTGARLAARLLRRWQGTRRDERPDLWLTYHVYYRAPDWLGPAVADALGIPYVIAEASHAPKRAGGPWAVGHAGAEAAIRRADALLGLNAFDAGCVTPLLDDPARLVPLAPFLDHVPFAAACARRADHRRAVDDAFGFEPATPLLVTVAMMRAGDKLASYRLLGTALAGIADRPWRLLVVGDGPARADVAAALAPLGDRVAWAGERPPDALPALVAAGDLFVWPALREAYGMALLEAQAAGTPVVAGRTLGVPAIVRDGQTGLLTQEGNADEFAAAVTALLDDPACRTMFGDNARATVARDHSIAAARRAIDRALSVARTHYPPARIRVG
jgi:glycosyltransferase involved in cell wall biosynthesis